ncbi:hypothetical protein SEA_JUSTBECAUSE_43 [Streptomyces phage JustBecause]|nr:hypothetical protein SEA_JUSTBECAUSE_43 [Streptomyces phage JustBecause]
MESRICAAVLNRNLTHSSFRLYCALVVLLKGRIEKTATEVSVPVLKRTVPGVKGKPLSDGSLRESLRELQAEGLIEVTGPKWSKVSLQVRLDDGGDDPGVTREQIAASAANVITRRGPSR